MLATNKLTATNIEPIAGWDALRQTWQQASMSKKALMLGGAVLAVSAVALGVAAALSLGVPPHAIMAGLHYGYEAVMLTKHITDYAQKAWHNLHQWFTQQPVHEPKIMPKASMALAFMPNLNAKVSHRQILVANAA